MNVDWNAFSFMLLSVFIGFFFSRFVNILGYGIKRIIYNQNLDPSILDAASGASSFLFLSFLLAGILSIINGWPVLTTVFLFIFAIAVLICAIICILRERKKIRETEGW